jgi:predicted nucleic acid-binding protein
MSRIFWDTMLFIYVLEDNPVFGPRVREVLERSYVRGDTLLTSHFAVGEVMAGGAGDRRISLAARDVLAEMGFAFLPFDGACVEAFSNLRSIHRLKALDMFLTNDAELLNRRLQVPGIHFISDFNVSAL